MMVVSSILENHKFACLHEDGSGISQSGFDKDVGLELLNDVQIIIWYLNLIFMIKISMIFCVEYPQIVTLELIPKLLLFHNSGDQR